MHVLKRPFPVYSSRPAPVPLIALAISFAALFLLTTVSREQGALNPDRVVPNAATIPIMATQLACSMKLAGAQSLAVGPAATTAVRPADPATRARVNVLYSRLPLEFEANRGQTAKRVKFVCRTGGGTVFLTGDEMVIGLRDGGRRTKDRLRSSVVSLRMAGANPGAEMTGEEPLPGRSSYFIGNNPTKWRTNMPNYAKVRCRDVYPGIDVVYYGNQERIEHDFVVRPGADPSSIALDVTGASGRPRVDIDGDLQIPTAAGQVTLEKPVVYQEIRGKRVQVSCGYVIGGPFSIQSHAPTRVAFRVARYDRRRELVIDPVLVYSTYLGGSFYDQGYGIAVDGTGAAYLTGLTYSPDFPTASPLQTRFGGNSEAFVAKISPDGSRLVYSTYLGGTASDGGTALAVDGTGAAYVAGSTFSSDFPTISPIQAGYGGAQDAFVSKISPDGSQLVYSTYLGGTAYDQVNAIAVDGAGAAYVAGSTQSADFPTASPLQPAYGGGGDAFVSKISPDGSQLVYSTYLGGSNGDGGYGIAVDATGAAYVTGGTGSTDFPTASPAQAALRGNSDAFVSKISPDGSQLVYSTYLGGVGLERGNGIAVDGTGAAYITGGTTSTDFPTVSPLQPASAGDYDAFVSKISADGSHLVYSTYLGGSSYDEGHGIAVDGAVAYVTGVTDSTNFPTASPLQPAFGGGEPGGSGDQLGDAFVSKISLDGSRLDFSTFLGGSSGDDGRSIAVGEPGVAYVTGNTSSTNFPTASALQPALKDGDAFVSKIRTTVALSFSPIEGPVGTSVVITGSVFTGAKAVDFNGTTANFSVDSDTQITTTVPTGATTGPISVTGPGGTGTSSQSFMVIYPPAAPSALKAVAGNTQIALSWSASGGATSYNVKRATTSGGPYTIVANPATTSYTDTGLTNGTTYYYVVSALNVAGEGANSSQISAAPEESSKGSARFLGTDTSTQGNWKSVYGADGYDVFEDSASLPGFALLTPSSTKRDYTWNSSPTDARALSRETAAGRIAACWYNPSSYQIDLNLTDGLTHRVALYFLDWEPEGRTETIQMLDAATGSVLDSETVSGFTGGKYLVWNLSGHVTIKVSNAGASTLNTVCSGIFFDAPVTPVVPAAPTGLAAAAGDAQVDLSWQSSNFATSYKVKRATVGGGPYTMVASPSTTSYTDTGLTNGTTYYYVVSAVNSAGESANSSEISATPFKAAAAYLGTDTSTQGNWKGVYGGDGYNVFEDSVSLPGYAQLTPSSTKRDYTWNSAPTDARALARGTAAGRIAACWYNPSSYSMDLNLTDGNSHRVAFYFLDWEPEGRTETIQILDAATGSVLDSENVSGFSGGKYLVWNLTGHVTVKVSNAGASTLNTVCSGIFIG